MNRITQNTKIKSLVGIFILVLLLSNNIFAQIFNPVVWQISSKQISDTEVELIFKADIDEHWHLYSQDIPMTPPATTFNFEDTKAYERIGKVSETASISEYDENFDMVLKYFTNEATFIQRIKLLSSERVDINGFITFMSCDDTQCLPPTDKEFSFVFNEKTNTQIETETIALSDKQSNSGNKSESKNTLIGFFFVAFLFGLAAILTPCVFPMIPMTVSFFMKDSENKAKGRTQATIYGLSIVAIYVFIGSVLAVVAGPGIANWLSTHWLPNLLFFFIFMIFAASFFGMFEIIMPHWLVNKSTANEEKGDFIGPVFMAFTLVLVSFSCTGPIVGTILVESAGGQILKPIIGMLGFSLAFALPFTLFAFFPQWLNKLPKSGGWLNSVKVVLGFLELALGLKFLSIADQTYHWGLLDREIYLALWIVIFTLMGFYLLGKIKFAHDSDVPFVSVPRLLLSIITFTFVVYMIPGLWGAPLKALSGYIPPMHTQDFNIDKSIRDNLKLANISTSSNERKAICETPKYHDLLHLPHGLEGYFDYNQALACAKKQNKPLFIDFTGHGCVNCREMEANVWADPAVLNRLENNFIITALYVDDKTRLPEEDWITSDYDGKVKKSIGKKFADFQISKFNTNAQPFYVLLNPDGEMLMQPKAYDLNIDNFIRFLDEGVKNFKEGKTVQLKR